MLWVLIGANDAVEGLSVARDVSTILTLNAMNPEQQIWTTDKLIQGKLGYDGLKESYERWEAENPNAAELVGLCWNALENWIGKGKGKGNSPSSSNAHNSAGSKSVGQVDCCNTQLESKLPKTSEPNSVSQRLSENGDIVQERYFDKNGHPYLDIDYNAKEHQIVPHEHTITYNDGKFEREKQGRPINK